jgi:hypothetical protein
MSKCFLAEYVFPYGNAYLSLHCGFLSVSIPALVSVWPITAFTTNPRPTFASRKALTIETPLD